MKLFDMNLSKIHLKPLIKELEKIDYDGVINGLDQLAMDFVYEKDPKYFKAILAIKKCMEDLQEVYDNKNKEED